MQRAITLMISPMYGHVSWCFLASELIVQQLHCSTVYLVHLDSNIWTPLMVDQCVCSVAETPMSCGEKVSDWCTIIFLKLLVDFCFPVTLTNLTLVDFLRAKNFSFETNMIFLFISRANCWASVLCYHKHLSKVQWSSVKHKDYWAQLVYGTIVLNLNNGLV